MLKLDRHQFEATDGKSVFYYTTPRNPSTRAMLILVHGMAEYAERYREFADYLYRGDIIVYAIDQRGHGATGLSGAAMGHFDDADGWQRVVDDVQELTGLAKAEHPDLPVLIFGHSMGSVVVRTCLIEFGTLYDGAVICGTTMGTNAAVRAFGKAIADTEIHKYGPTHSSTALAELSFGGYNKKFAPNRTAYDWLSVSEANVDAYLADPLCGFFCTAAFYRDLFSGLDFANNASNMAEMPESLPILLIAGAEDPVGNMGKEVKLIYHRMKVAGMTDVTLRLIPGKRHEILNEDNRVQTFGIILEFLKRAIHSAKHQEAI